MQGRDRWLLGILGAFLVASFVTLAALDDLHRRVPLLLSVYAIAFAAYAAAVVMVLRRGGSGRSTLVVIVGAAAVARLVLVPATPVMSTDIYRYLWEGRVIGFGFNPFALAPDDPALEGLRTPDYEGVTYKHMETIYPPVAQAVFAAGAAVRPTVNFQKLLFVVFDLATVLLLILLLPLRRLDSSRAVVYAWNPLVIFETGHSGHVDAVGVFFMVLALFLLLRNGGRQRVRRAARAWAFVAFAASFLAKYVTVVLAPYFAVRRRYLPWLALALAVAVVGFLPFAGAGKKLIASLTAYSTEWRFNGLAFRTLTALWDDPLMGRRLLGALAALAIVVQAVRQGDVVRYAVFAFGAVLLAVPTLYPWYVIWIVPFLCVVVNRAWILFTALLFLSYLVWPVSARTGEWELPVWVLALEYAPFLLLLAWDAVRARHTQRGEAPA